MRNILLLPRRLGSAVVRLYQQTLSPDHGPLRHLHSYGYCRHSPTCSEYARQQIEQRGLIIGTWRTFWRLLHCHPFARVSDEKLQELAQQAANKNS